MLLPRSTRASGRASALLGVAGLSLAAALRRPHLLLIESRVDESQRRKW